VAWPDRFNPGFGVCMGCTCDLVQLVDLIDQWFRLSDQGRRAECSVARMA